MKGDKTFLKILISYVSIILLTVVFIGALTVGTLFTRLEIDTEKLNHNIIEQTEQVLDGEWRAVLSLPHQFMTNDEFKNILSMNYSNQGDKVYKSWKAIKRLYSYQTGYTSIGNIAVYSKKSDFVLDSSSVYDKKEYYDIYFKDSSLKYEDWVNCLENSKFTHSFIPVNFNSENKDMLIYCQGLHRDNPENGGLFMAFIDKKELLQKLNIDGLKNSVPFAVMDRDGEILIKNSSFDIKPNISLLKNEEGSFIQKNYKVLYDTSDVLDVKYLYLFPKNTFLGSVGYVLPTFFLILFLAIAVSVIAANFSAKRMQRSILAILDENELLSKNLDEYIMNGREKVFLNLLYNIPLKQKEIDEIKELCTENKLFRVFVVKGTERDRLDVYNDRIAIAWTEVDVILADILSNIPAEFYTVRTSETSYAYILSYTHNDTDLVIKGLNSAIKQFVKEYGICITASVGGEVKDIYSVNYSYEGALFAARYNTKENCAPVIFCDDIEQIENKKLYYTVEKEQLLVRSIKTGKTDELKSLMDEIYNVNFIQRRLSQEMIKRLIMHIQLMIFKILDEKYEPDDKKGESFIKECQNIIHNDNAEESFRILKNVCIAISEQLPEQKGEVRIKSRIEDYILKNYSNMDLSLNMLAEHIGMSYNYLSKIFKDVFGTNFVTYVTAVRLEEAKKLLKNTDLTVEQIAQNVGFGGSNSFIRIFKKYYNITPKQFKNRNV